MKKFTSKQSFISKTRFTLIHFFAFFLFISNSFAKDKNYVVKHEVDLTPIENYSYGKELPHNLFIRDTFVGDRSNRFIYLLDQRTGKIYTRNFKDDYFLLGGQILTTEKVKKHYPKLKDQNINPNLFHLHDGNGGPNLPKGEKIVEIAAQSDIIVAVSNTDRVYFYKPTNNKLPTLWQKRLGSPLMRKLYLPSVEELGGERIWTFSVSAGPRRKFVDNRAEDFMADDDQVAYYEDGIGAKIPYGFTPTIYVLSKNRKVIRYWDTGLPTSFSRGFLTPDYGNIVGLNISAAASTIMLLGRDPRLATSEKDSLAIYTRMYDYEMNGSCPGFVFKFMDDSMNFCTDSSCSCGGPLQLNESMADRFFDKDEVITNFVRHIPLPTWVKHELPKEVVNKKGKASITGRISIFMKGHGNSSRELRVEGKNKKGFRGYYRKMITDTKWNFVETEIWSSPYPQKKRKIDLSFNEQINETNKKPIVYNLKTNGSLGLLKIHHLYGIKVKNVKLKNFHFFLTPDQPADLIFKIKKGNYPVISVKTKLHISDGWAFLAQNKERSELVGNVDGEPKIVLGTLNVPGDVRNSTEQAVKEFYDLFLKQYHLMPNLFSIIANNTHVVMGCQPIERSTSEWLAYQFHDPLIIDFGLKNKDKTEIKSLYIEEASDSKLVLEDEENANIKDLTKYILLNRNFIRKIDQEHIKERVRVGVNGLVNFVLSSVLIPVNTLGSFANVFSYSRGFGVVSNYIPKIFPIYSRTYLEMLLNWDTPGRIKAKEIARERMRRYKILLKTKIQKKNPLL